MKPTSLGAKIFVWCVALFWLVVCLLPLTQLISVTFSTSDRGMVSTFFPNSLTAGIENIQRHWNRPGWRPPFFKRCCMSA